ncbi:hypothetical protein [Paenibacillus hexagrammi]|uniref:Uncharacterized protein n=1 Tax=Paenibacillus hexagrammi TaxID=2908839 RepID=A0ABY3SL82_9BACL|nr:hypothetical protein [Paenibacillus sp. YPD9-1]UJF33841.1 hypothetical protein L0M14_00815 [Paenibacillus sp. YPD9-1]
MKWEEELSCWLGTPIEVHIEDQAGHDPIAPPKKMTLGKIRMTDDNYLQIYMNEHQFLAIPLKGEEHTSYVTSEEGAVLHASDLEAQLVYKVHFGV